jgi:hypothetical protein
MCSSASNLRANHDPGFRTGQVAWRVAIHLLYVDEWTYVRAANVSQVVIMASDRAAWLKR